MARFQDLSDDYKDYSLQDGVCSLETLKNFYQTTGHHIHLDCNLQFLKFNSPVKAQPPVLIPS
jgi:hypothetical protein